MLLEKARVISIWFNCLLSTIACVFLFVITLTLVDQILDIQMIAVENLRTIISERSFQSIPRREMYLFLTSSLFISILGLVVYLTATKLILFRAARIALYNPRLVTTRAFRVFSHTAPMALFGVIIGSFPLGMLVAYKVELNITRYVDAARLVYQPVGLAVGTSLIAAVLLLLATALIGRERTINFLFSIRGSFLVTAGLAILILLIAYHPVLVTRMLGTIPLVVLFVGFLAYYSALFSLFTNLSGLSLIYGLFGCAVAYAYFDLNDNHQIRYTTKQLKVADHKIDEFETSFASWMNARNDREYYNGRQVPYPVYIVAGEGGGLYAAYNIAMFLAKLQDACPTFAQHLFTITSVSGGSLGAAVFAGLAREFASNSKWEPCATPGNKHYFQSFMREYFSRDFLAPLVAAGLFPDFAQRFLPFPIQLFDRSRALESSFYAAWDWSAGRAKAATRHPNPFGQSLDAFWDANGSVPNLAVNLTSVETGARITIAPVYFSPTPTTVHIIDAVAGNCPGAVQYIAPSITLATAVSLSARFPWVTPVGWLETGVGGESSCSGERPYGSRLYLGDGGYFENSGTELATELTPRLLRTAKNARDTFPYGIAVHVIKIGVFDEYARRFTGRGGEKSNQGYGELLTPIVTLLNARRARTLAVTHRYFFDSAYFREDHPLFRRDAQQGLEGSGSAYYDFYPVDLNATDMFLPLGWQLSKLSMDRMEDSAAGKSTELIERIRGELMVQ